jgi:aromatic amino acid aminotransferase I
MAPPAIDIASTEDTQALITPDPLTVNGLTAHRANAPMLVAGVAAWTSSDLFKTHVSRHTKITSHIKKYPILIDVILDT